MQSLDSEWHKHPVTFPAPFSYKKGQLPLPWRERAGMMGILK